MKDHQPTTMQWVVYDMQRRSPIAWHFSAPDAFDDAKKRNDVESQAGRYPARYFPMSRTVLLRISKAGNQ